MHDTTTDAIDGEAVKILDRNITVCIYHAWAIGLPIEILLNLN